MKPERRKIIIDGEEPISELSVGYNQACDDWEKYLRSRQCDAILDKVKESDGLMVDKNWILERLEGLNYCERKDLESDGEYYRKIHNRDIDQLIQEIKERECTY